MPSSPHLIRKLRDAIGAEAAEDLTRWMDAMDAQNGDVGALRHEMQMGFARMDARFEQVQTQMDARFAAIDARFELMGARFDNYDMRFQNLDSRFETRLEKGLREQTRFFFLAWSVMLAAIIGLYAR